MEETHCMSHSVRVISAESKETYQVKKLPLLSDTVCQPLLSNMTDIYFIRTSAIWEKLFSSCKDRHPLRLTNFAKFLFSFLSGNVSF